MPLTIRPSPENAGSDTTRGKTRDRGLTRRQAPIFHPEEHIVREITEITDSTGRVLQIAEGKIDPDEALCEIVL